MDRSPRFGSRSSDNCSWADVVDNAPSGPDNYENNPSGAPVKPAYVPPHLRNKPAASQQAITPAVSNGSLPPMNDEIDLGDALNLNIRRSKYVKPTPVQRYTIPISLAGRDLMACAQTGSGKTAAFCFPIISGIMRQQSVQKPRGTRTVFPLALILSPTRELSSQKAIDVVTRKYLVIFSSNWVIMNKETRRLSKIPDEVGLTLNIWVGKQADWKRSAEESEEFEEFGAKRAKIRDLESIFRSEGELFRCALI
ncbi:DEAD-box ATP-dependent RNA helicase 11-like [Helianthus annuus]|uniref:DEAD-box ATP-dependent RNA helicase 11-like n=1 Tax=Helianthus annuus TaxID=4232 RepID=UPI000B909EC9|nr:DEAD-box ATP-dependent RNA helicase 11-like [Helianthus annuus]